MFKFKDDKKIEMMTIAGKKLAIIKKKLKNFSQVGIKFEQIEKMTFDLILASKGRPNFALVPGYRWATCINKNQGLCHGIPQNNVIEDGDLITIDLGMIFGGYNVDSSMSFIVGLATDEKKLFLQAGYQAFSKVLKKATIGNSIYDLSSAMEKYLTKKGYQMVYQLTGHSIGKKLHEAPFIPCFANIEDKKYKLYDGQTLAIEVMYTQGNAELRLAKDGWTYETKDGALSCLVEETILITNNSPIILT